MELIDSALVLLIREDAEGRIREVRVLPLERALPMVLPYLRRKGGEECEKPFPSSWGFYSEPSS